MNALEIVRGHPLPSYELCRFGYPEFKDADLLIPYIAPDHLSAWLTGIQNALVDGAKTQNGLQQGASNLLAAFPPLIVASALRYRHRMRGRDGEYVIDNRGVIVAGGLRRAAIAKLPQKFANALDSWHQSGRGNKLDVGKAVCAALVPGGDLNEPIPRAAALTFYAMFLAKQPEEFGKIIAEQPYLIRQKGRRVLEQKMASDVLDQLVPAKVWSPQPGQETGTPGRAALAESLLTHTHYFAEAVRHKILATLYARILEAERSKLPLPGSTFLLFLSRPTSETGNLVPIHSRFWHTFLHFLPKSRAAVRQALDAAVAAASDPGEAHVHMWADHDLRVHVMAFADCWPEVQAMNESAPTTEMRRAESLEQMSTPDVERTLEERERDPKDGKRIRENLPRVLATAERLLKARASLPQVLGPTFWGIPEDQTEDLIDKHFGTADDVERVRRLKAALIDGRGASLDVTAHTLGLKPKTFYDWLRRALQELLTRALRGQIEHRGRRPAAPPRG